MFKMFNEVSMQSIIKHLENFSFSDKKKKLFPLFELMG